MKTKVLFILLFVATILFVGCDFRTSDEMYAVPARPAADYNLQQAINSAMSGLDYCAPKTGTNQQIVQTVDLDGNGDLEYLLFAKGDDDHPLKIFIFDKKKDSYCLIDTISCNGSAFDRVEYIQMDNNPGVEIVVGYQLNDMLTGSLGVYSFDAGRIGQILSTNYTNFVLSNLNHDEFGELFVIRPGINEWSNGIAELYQVRNSSIERSVELNISAPAADVSRVLLGKLEGEHNGIYVTEKAGDSALKTDVFTIYDDVFINVTQFAGVDTAVQTIGNYFVYASDIDGDGITELPVLQDMVNVTQEGAGSPHKILRWESIDAEGAASVKGFTYHCFVDGWYVELSEDLVGVLTVAKQGKRVDFFSWDREYGVPVRLFTVDVLTGQNREAQAQEGGYIRLHTANNAIFVGELTSNGESYGLTESLLVSRFHMIQQEVSNEGK